MILDYLKKHAEKAYREITKIITSPVFLFSNDPKLIGIEESHNFIYIHGFNRLIKKDRVPSDKLLEAFSFLEQEVELYLKKHYTDKEFVFYLSADALAPTFIITLASYYEDTSVVEQSIPLIELIEWYKENACFNGLEIIENKTNDKNIEAGSDSVRTYVKIIST
ncbi:hypothetical protein MHB54_21420 [Paenibacillus sp. FSL M7-0802]|uniref:hypothetical protein n=1 Tax=Paenibacillus sp. FSL M7-0802 TaxID=2921536 RepID=UPI0030F8065C